MGIMLALALVVVGASQNAAAAYAAIYGNGGNDVYTFNNTSLANFKASGWNGLIMFAVGVQPNGDITYDGTTLVSNGSYVGSGSWSSNVNVVKAAPTTVYRYEVCVGGASDYSFANIQNLIASQGTGTGSILYKNFHALKSAVPGIDAINDDDEYTFDLNSSTAFGNMLGGLGYKFTFAPYNNQNFWVQLKNNLGNICDIVYLQCYSGGAQNIPSTWDSAFGGGFHVTPGIESNSHSSSTFANWYNTGTRNGFYWPDVSWSPNSNWGASDIIEGIGLHSGQYTIANDNSGLSLAPNSGGTGNGTTIVQYHLNSSAALQWNLTYQSSVGFWEISGVSSGRAITITGDSMDDNAPLELYDYSADHSQLFSIVDKGNGWYRCQFVHSGLSMIVSGSSTASGASIVQYNNDNAAQAWWMFRQFQIPGTPGS